jgi:monooxygenase
MRRANHTLPRQGSKLPWKVLMHYEKDSKILLEDPVEDGVLQFAETSVDAAVA